MPEFKFKVGDRVEVVGGNVTWVGKTGTVKNVDEYDRAVPFLVKFEDGNTRWFTPSELNETSPEAKLDEQIQKLEELLALMKLARDLPKQLAKSVESLNVN